LYDNGNVTFVGGRGGNVDARTYFLWRYHLARTRARMNTHLQLPVQLLIVTWGVLGYSSHNRRKGTGGLGSTVSLRLEEDVSFTSGAVRMLGGANGNSSTNVTFLDSETPMPELLIQVSSASNLTINGDLELKAGTWEPAISSAATHDRAASLARRVLILTVCGACAVQARPNG
jgi:hypothetical protein